MIRTRRISYFGYIRIPITAESETENIKELQEKAIKEWVASKGDDGRLAVLECDVGHSSILKVKKRPGLRTVRNCIGKTGVLLAFSIKDVARTFVEFLNIEEKIREKGGHFVSIFEKYDTSTTTGLSHMRTSYITNISLSIQNSKHVNWEYEVPYGWNSNEENSKVTIYENFEQQEGLTLIRKLCLENTINASIDYNKVSDYLNGTCIKRKGGKEWSSKHIIKVLERADLSKTGKLIEKNTIRYCYGYIRVSTCMQSERGTSLQTQEDAIRKWTDDPRNNAQLVMLESDIAISGTLKIDKRPGLKNLIQNLKKDSILLTCSISRMSRNFTELMNIINTVKEHESNMISISEGLDTFNNTGILGMQIMASVAEIQILQISKHAKEAAATFKEQKRHYGSVPYGWKKISKDKGSGLCEVPEQQDIIKVIREMRATRNEKGEATPFPHIAELLNKNRVPPPRGKMWYPGTIKGIHDRTEVFVKGREDIASPN